MTRLGCILVLVLAVADASAAEPFRQIPVLLQDSSKNSRASGDLFGYFERLAAEAEEFMGQLEDETPRFGSIVFAVRPDRSRKVWLDLHPALTPEVARAMLARLESVPPCQVSGGTFVAAINMTFWHPTDLAFEPMPDEWREAAEKSGMVEVTELVDSLWPPAATPNTSLERTRERLVPSSYGGVRAAQLSR